METLRGIEPLWTSLSSLYLYCIDGKTLLKLSKVGIS